MLSLAWSAWQFLTVRFVRVVHALSQLLAETQYLGLTPSQMIFFPRWHMPKLERRGAGRFWALFSSVWPLCLAYVALLAASWTPDTLSIIMPGSLKEGLSGADGSVDQPCGALTAKDSAMRVADSLAHCPIGAGGFNPQFFPKLEVCFEDVWVLLTPQGLLVACRLRRGLQSQ
jgi:hypothetical protein